MRTEHDCLGSMQLDDALDYGIQTERARLNFPVSGLHVHRFPVFLRMLLKLKKAAALANASIGALDEELSQAIAEACAQVAEENFSARFPQDIFQGGGGTSINMNANEVIALRANLALTGKKGYDRVHPNTHVNMGQSTNDVIPSALKLSCLPYIADLDRALAGFERALSEKAREYAAVVKIGRTCLQDALPVTLGQEFGGYAVFIGRMRSQLPVLEAGARTLTMGGTAVGTGLGSFEGYREALYRILSDELQADIRPEGDMFDGMQNGDYYLDVSGGLRKIAAGISKMATDMRIMSSGPRAGLREIVLPAVQPGSSIMPGKINPVIPEMVNQVAYQVVGNDVAIAMAVEGGELDLNVWEPVILKNITESFTLVINAVNVFRTLCIEGLEANAGVLRGYAEQSLALSTVIAALFGYEKGAEVAEYAHVNGRSVKETCLALGLLTSEQADELLEPLVMTDNDAYQVVLKKYAFLRQSL